MIGLLSSVVSDISDLPDPDAAVRKIRKDCLRCRAARPRRPRRHQLSAHFYPALVVGRRDIENGVRALEVALRYV